MLQQNWFNNPRFIMFEDYGESQSFYDIKTGNIYVVFEEYGQKGNTIIQEITKESIEYKPNYERYMTYRKQHRKFQVSFVVNGKGMAAIGTTEDMEKIFRDKFGNDYLIENVVVDEVNEIGERMKNF